MILPSHLGGHFNETHVDEGVLDFMVQHFNVKSFLDIGCGPGGMLELARNKGLKVLGVDGDNTLTWSCPVIVHDYTLGSPDISEKFDLCWSCEFLEHVEEKYIPNFMDSFTKAKYVIATYALPGQGGYHHVNEQNFAYWHDVFSSYGFVFSSDITRKLRKASTMRNPFFLRTGAFFENSQFQPRAQ